MPIKSNYKLSRRSPTGQPRPDNRQNDYNSQDEEFLVQAIAVRVSY